MVALLIAFPQMSLVYKSGQPVIDINKVKIEIPPENFDSGGGAGDIMKDLEKGSSARDGPGGAAQKGATDAGKSDEDKAAEDLQKALGGK